MPGWICRYVIRGRTIPSRDVDWYMAENVIKSEPGKRVESMLKPPEPYRLGDTRSWAEAKREFEEYERAKVDELFENNPVIQAAAQKIADEEYRARQYEKQRPMREAEMAYRLHVDSGLRPLGADEGWDIPEPLGPPPPPKFDPAWMPSAAGDFVRAAATSFQCAVDFVALMVLGAASVASLGKAVVRVTADWTEPTQLYISAVLPPSERKSPVFFRVFRPIKDWEDKQNAARALQIRQDTAYKKMLEKHLERAIAKGDEAEVARLTEELFNFQPMTPITLMIGDSTPEKAAMLASENGGCLSIVAPEAGIFNTMLGRYSQVPNLDFFLNGYSGEAVSIHRVGRPAVRIPRATVAMVLAVQPTIIKELFENSEAVGRGLVARFLFAVPEPLSGKRAVDVPEIPESVDKAYDRMITALLDVPQMEVPRELTLTTEAAQAFRAWRKELEERRKDDLQPLESWGWSGKLDGQTIRIAATIALMESPSATKITAVQLRRAVCIARWAIEHARAASATLPVKTGESAASVMLEAIKRHNPPTFTTREAYHWTKGRKTLFPNVNAARAALQTLLKKGWLRRAPFPERDKETGRPAEPRWIPTIYLNTPIPESTKVEAGEELIL